MYLYPVFKGGRRLAEDAECAQTAHHASPWRSGLLWWREQSGRWPDQKSTYYSIPGVWWSHCPQCEWPLLQICHGRLVKILQRLFVRELKVGLDEFEKDCAGVLQMKGDGDQWGHHRGRKTGRKKKNMQTMLFNPLKFRFVAWWCLSSPEMLLL